MGFLASSDLDSFQILSNVSIPFVRNPVFEKPVLRPLDSAAGVAAAAPTAAFVFTTVVTVVATLAAAEEAAAAAAAPVAAAYVSCLPIVRQIGTLGLHFDRLTPKQNYFFHVFNIL